MIKRLAIALFVASSLLSAAASAEPSGNIILQGCFRTLSAAQLQIWANISRATLQSCVLFEQYYVPGNYEGFWNAISLLSDRLDLSIEQIEGRANVSFEMHHCGDVNGNYNNVSFDRWGFNHSYEYPFYFSYLCGGLGN